jgi:hypothetical protein
LKGSLTPYKIFCIGYEPGFRIAIFALMNRSLFILFIPFLALSLISWGTKGHRQIAATAEKHLHPRAKKEIAMLLSGTNMIKVSTWADEARNQAAFKYTAPWHYVNLPANLNYPAFRNSLKNDKKSNLYNGLLKSIQTLKDPKSSNEQKQTALKFVIHLVADAHQPMHVSRAADKGGSRIQVRFNNQGTNLHQLWDSGLLNYASAAKHPKYVPYKPASTKQIKQWQKDDPVQWLFESYEISNNIYTEVPKNSILGDAYFQKHIRTVEQRLEMGGIRLAGLLNEIFKAP